MQKYMDVVLTTDGSPIGGASVYVTNLSGTVPVIYSDDGVTVAANPLTTNSLGAFSFYAADGRYTLSISVGGYPVTTISDILLDDPTNASANVVVGGSVDNSPIGASTPSSGRFTTLAASGNATLGDAEATDTHAVKGATTVLANSASPAMKVTQTGAGDAFVVEDSASTDSTPFVIAADGRTYLGATTGYSGVFNSAFLQLHNVAGNTAQAIHRYTADGFPPDIDFCKSRNATTGLHTIVQNGDDIGTFRFAGSDGTNFIQAASITAEVDGTPGTNDMPGRLVFSTTADGASVPTERMRITSGGQMLLGTTGSVFGAVVEIRADTINAHMGLLSVSDTVRPTQILNRYRAGGTSVQSGDTLGAIEFKGFDGTSNTQGAAISAQVDGTPGTSDMPGRLVFSTTADGASSPTERMRIDSLGNVGVGGSPFTSTKFRLTGTHPSSAASPIQTYSDPTFPATGITQPTNFYSTPSTASNAGVGYTVAMLVHYFASQGTIHADSTVTVQTGFLVDGTLTGAGTNYGFYSGLAASGAARYNFYAAGDAPNRFVGETLVIGAKGLGYGTGAGGTVTQATSRTTGVTLNKPTGAITLFTAAGSATAASFTVTNTVVAATDTIVLSVKSGTNKYITAITAVAAGSFEITFWTTGGTASDAPVINFAVIKGATS